MKKVIVFSLFLFILTGCSNENNKNGNENDIINEIEMDITDANYVCEIENSNKEYELIGKYAIYLDNDIVNKINSVEIIKSDDDKILNYFESYYLLNYDKIANYSGYEYTIDKEENKLIINVKVDYQSFNTESYVIDFPDNASIFDENNKLKIDKLLEEYDKQNIKCEKK